MAVKHSDALVVFGCTGDLAHKQIFPALYAMVKRGEQSVIRYLMKPLVDSLTHSFKEK